MSLTLGAALVRHTTGRAAGFVGACTLLTSTEPRWNASSARTSWARSFSVQGTGRRRRFRRVVWERQRRREADAVRMDGAAALEEETDPGQVAGTSLRVLRYPHPLLRAENESVTAGGFDEDLKQLAREMLLIMYASQGVGLAAPQVGVNKRLLVFNPEGSSKAFLQEIVLVNPKIVGSSKKTLVEPEACLSFPGMSGNVRRHDWVKIEAYRLNGKKFTVKYEGWKAKIFQHEFDHLQGVLYVDRLEGEDRKNVQGRLDELVQEYKANPYKDLSPAL